MSPPVCITVLRTGGFGGLTRRASLETDDERLVEAARTALDESRTVPPIGVPDGFQYEIMLGERSGYCADPRLTDTQRHVISQVLNEGA